MDRVPVMLNGRAVGDLTAVREGLYVRCEACCRLEPGTLARLYAVGKAGELRPVEPPEGSGVWEPAPAPERLFRGDFLRGELRGCRGVLTRKEGEIRYLALPFDCRRPFLLTSLFCFARVRPIGGKAYAVFAFDRAERPVFR